MYSVTLAKYPHWIDLDAKDVEGNQRRHLSAPAEQRQRKREGLQHPDQYRRQNLELIRG